MKLLSDIDVSAKTVFLRADLDVPIRLTNDERKTTNAEEAIRLQNLKPTIEYLIGHGVKKIIIAGHVDRPQKPDPSCSTANLVSPLEKILSRSVAFKKDFDNTTPADLALLSQLVLLENLRFWKGETANDPDFAKKLASLADVYVNDAFGNCHRPHASMVGVSQLLPHAAGLQLQREVAELSTILSNAQHPFVAVVGGAKIETKVPVITHLSKIADIVLVGGELPLAIKKTGAKFAENVIVASLTPSDKDISIVSTQDFVAKIRSAKVVVWNGPMGLFEEGFIKGTRAVADAIIDARGYSVVGGGETTQFLAEHDLLLRFSFVSTGGGAMLEFLAGRELPGIKALD